MYSKVMKIVGPSSYSPGKCCVKFSKKINKNSIPSELPKIAMLQKNALWSFRVWGKACLSGEISRSSFYFHILGWKKNGKHCNRDFNHKFHNLNELNVNFGRGQYVGCYSSAYITVVMNEHMCLNRTSQWKIQLIGCWECAWQFLKHPLNVQNEDIRIKTLRTINVDKS